MWIQPSTLSATMLALPQRHCWSAIMLAPGDLVKVVADDFAVKSFDAKGWVGKVTEVRGEPDAEEWGACCELAWDEPELVVAFSGLPVTGYFEESEVRRLDARGGSAPITEGDRVEIIRDVTIKGRECKWTHGHRDGCVGHMRDGPCVLLRGAHYCSTHSAPRSIDSNHG